jgi:hypothetical protein
VGQDRGAVGLALLGERDVVERDDLQCRGDGGTVLGGHGVAAHAPRSIAADPAHATTAATRRSWSGSATTTA